MFELNEDFIGLQCQRCPKNVMVFSVKTDEYMHSYLQTKDAGTVIVTVSLRLVSVLHLNSNATPPNTIHTCTNLAQSSPLTFCRDLYTYGVQHSVAVLQYTV